MTARMPDVRICAFGHVGDGNLHSSRGTGGSFAAEHGVGRLKRDEVRRTKAPVAYALMRDLNRTQDPTNILNPGKMIEVSAH